MPSPSASREGEPDLGPFFSVDAMTPEAGWRPLGADLASPDVMGAWIDRARERTAAARALRSDGVDVRALGAVLHLGVCARVLSPWIGSALRQTPSAGLTGADVPSLDDLLWQDDGTTTFPLALAPDLSARQALAAPVARAGSDASRASAASAGRSERRAITRPAPRPGAAAPSPWRGRLRASAGP